MACHKTSLTANKMGERTRVWEFMRTENDAELIEAYAKRDDQCAFAEIVSRHGAMVFHVCFRKLTNRHDAEDASQAVFMALIKNSEKMHWKDSLAGWLHNVDRRSRQRWCITASSFRVGWERSCRGIRMGDEITRREKQR